MMSSGTCGQAKSSLESVGVSLSLLQKCFDLGTRGLVQRPLGIMKFGTSDVRTGVAGEEEAGVKGGKTLNAQNPFHLFVS